MLPDPTDKTEPAAKPERARILVVDDQLPMLQSVQALLSLQGHPVDVATNGTAALELLRRESFSLVLLDLQMPETSGLQVLDAIRKSQLDCVVVVVSGQGSFDNIKKAMKLGAFDFIRKPYKPEELIATVGQALDELHQRRQDEKKSRSLHHSERMHRFIVNHSPDFIYILDSKGRFSYVNSMAEQLLGYQRQELIGQHFTRILHPLNAEETLKVFSEQRTGRRASINVEVRLKGNPQFKQAGADWNREPVVELNSLGIYTRRAQKNIYIGTFGSARDISVRKKAEAQISYQAYHDLLTRLPNRSLFEDRAHQLLAQSRRSGETFALMFMDLDRFKQINDNFGHIIGDRVLQQVAERIRACLRAEDTLSRFGGDEFSLLLPGISSREGTVTVAEKILKAVRQPFLIDGHDLYLSVSLGIAVYPDAGESHESLIQSADVAMYHVKANGKDGYAFYSDAMANGSVFLSIERDMYQALEQRQFQVFFQPKVDPVSHTIVGMEALLRWQHPTHGLLYPEEFINVAEESRLIVPLGCWVLSNVCEEMLRWQKQGLPKIVVSLNISPVQLEDEDFADQFIETLAAYDLSGDLFEIEITENILIRGEEKVSAMLRKLRSAGVSVTLDDFGRGYASLSYLQSFPVDSLKIDRSFVRDIGSKQHQGSIVDGIAMMAKGMQMNISAGGVENRDQLDYLVNLGCHQVQGYFFSPPVSASDTFNFLVNCPLQGPHFNLH